jgi:hypothetical protein
MPGKYEATVSAQIRIPPRVRDAGIAVSSYVCDLHVTEMEAHSLVLAQRDHVGLMLQDFRHEDGRVHLPAEKLGLGVSIAIICGDALAFYREVTRAASRPGGRLWAIECG